MISNSTPQNGNDLPWQAKVFDCLSYPSIIIAPDKTLISANKKFFEKFNLCLEDIQGKKCYSLFLYRDTPCNSDGCPISKVINQKKSHSYTLKRQYRWEDRVFSPILDDQGQVEYIIGSMRDISKIKSLERQLTGVKEGISQIIESSASAIVAADRQGNIDLMNNVAKELFQIDGNGHKIKNTTQLYPPGKAQEIMQMLRDDGIGERGKLLIPKINIVNAKGEQIPVEMSAAIIYDENGNESATMAIYNNLKNKIEVEQKLKEAQTKLAQSEKLASMGKLAAGVAHEINNPLTGILFYASLLLERNDLDAALKEDIGYIVEDANRCKEIVKSLLVYSRSTDSHKDAVNINTVVEQSLRLIRDQKKLRNITIKKDLPNKMMMVNADTNKLNQVLINLIINAVDAMEGSGSLILRTDKDTFNKKVYLEIKDTGSGIPHENLSKIFDPFFTTKEVGKSTGLGLSIVYGIMEEHGGSIFVKRTSAKGTTFILEFPLCQPSRTEGFLC
ncbi:MAG: PAS domain S-box protein [Desulfobacteraceae bacterium]|nr:PAS domain S-box protein [Desulfobacteraceae bacterium]